MRVGANDGADRKVPNFENSIQIAFEKLKTK